MAKMCQVNQGSGEVNDYICNACEDQNNLETSADFYCKLCERFNCGNCIHLHVQLFAKHNSIGRVDIDKWPVSKKVVDFLQACDLHKDNKLDKFCNLHRQLCCTQCVSDQHSQCIEVTPISELSNTEHTNLQGLSVDLLTVLEEMKSLQSNQVESVQSLQGEYKKHEESTIQQIRRNINSTINTCTSDEMEQTIKENACMSIISFLDDFDNSTAKELKEINDEVISIKGSITCSISKCTGLQKELTQLYECTQKIGDNKELCLIASIKCEPKIQQALTLLGKSDKVFTVLGKSEHIVSIPSDSDKCNIACCCFLEDGQVLVVDHYNKKVKLLNQHFQVVSHWDVVAYPHDACQITPSKVAVTVDDLHNIHEVQFITVTQSQLVLGSKFQLQHMCPGIAHHQGDLFITSNTELYKYSLSGKQVSRLYENTAGPSTVYRCAASPTGDKLYVTNLIQSELLILARDGTILTIFTDPGLQRPGGVYVTPAGHVLVCGGWPGTVLHVKREGRRKLATLATRERDGVLQPWSICYSSTKSFIIVGQYNNNNILVFRVE